MKNNDNSFEDLCKRLDKNKRARGDMDYVKLYLVQEIMGKKCNFLKLKAECQSGDFIGFASLMIAIGAIVLTVIGVSLDFFANFLIQNEFNVKYLESNQEGVLFHIVPTTQNYVEKVGPSILFMLALIYSGYALYKINQYNYINRWRKYILVYLEDIENNWDEYFTTPENGHITSLKCEFKGTVKYELNKK